MSKLNLTPETLRQLYPPMPEKTRLKLQHNMRQLMLEAPKAKPVRRISRGLAIAIAITALLLSTAIAEVATGVVSHTIRQVVRMVTGQPEKPASLSRLNFDELSVNIAEIRVDSRAIYLHALSRMHKNSDWAFQYNWFHEDPGVMGRPENDIFTPGEKRMPPHPAQPVMDLYPYVDLYVNPQPMTAEDYAHQEPEDPRYANSMLDSKRMLAEYGSYGPGYQAPAHLNSDGSLYSQVMRMHRSTGKTVDLEIEAEAGLLNAEELWAPKVVQSQKQTVRLKVPVMPDLRQPATVPIQQDVLQGDYHVDKLTFTFTPLGTYVDMYWRPLKDMTEMGEIFFELSDDQEEWLPARPGHFPVHDYTLQDGSGHISTTVFLSARHKPLPEQLTLTLFRAYPAGDYRYDVLRFSLEGGVQPPADRKPEASPSPTPPMSEQATSSPQAGSGAEWQQVPVASIDGQPIASLDLLNVNVKIWTVQADSRRVYVEALSRSMPDNPVFFGDFRGIYELADDKFPPQERRGPRGGYDNYNLPMRAVVLQLEPEAAARRGQPRFPEDSRDDLRAWPMQRADIDQGPTPYNDSEMYFTQGNSDGSQYAYASMLHEAAGDNALISLAATVGTFDENPDAGGYRFAQSERRILKLSIPIQPDTHPQLTIPIQQEFPDIEATVDSITFTFTPLATYYDVTWHWTKGKPSPYHDRLAFALTDRQGRELRNKMPVFNGIFLKEGATSFEGSLPAGDPPRELQLHWQLSSSGFLPRPHPIQFQWQR